MVLGKDEGRELSNQRACDFCTYSRSDFFNDSADSEITQAEVIKVDQISDLAAEMNQQRLVGSNQDRI